MILERENTKAIENPTAKQVSASLMKLSGSKRSFASLTSEDGSYIQMAGGGFSCCIETNIKCELSRASQSPKIVPWEESSIIPTSAGDVCVEPEEYFSIKQVVELFTCFLSKESYPENIKWKVINARL